MIYSKFHFFLSLYAWYYQNHKIILPVFCMAFSLSASVTAFWSWTHYWIVVRFGFKYSYINIVLSKYRADSHRITPTYNLLLRQCITKNNINSNTVHCTIKWTYNAVEVGSDHVMLAISHYQNAGFFFCKLRGLKNILKPFYFRWLKS